MPPIVLELQRDALDKNVPVSDLLRKALVVAKKLHLPDFQQWIELELAGYPLGDSDAVPNYRNLFGIVKAQDPYRGWLPVVNTDQNVRDFLSHRPCPVPVPVLESLVAQASGGGRLDAPFEPDIEAMIIKSIGANLPVTLVVQQSSLIAILDAVRTIILNWSLKLEEDGILGDGLSFSDNEKERAHRLPSNITNYNAPVQTYQFQQGASSIMNVSIAQLDLAKLKDLLGEIRSFLPQSDITADDHAQVKADLDTIDIQLASPKPKSSIITESLKSIRSVLESATGSVLCNVLPKLNDILASLF